MAESGVPNDLENGTPNNLVVFQPPQPPIPSDALIILLLGLTGAGKTSCINRITDAGFPVGHRMSSGTQKSQVVISVVDGKNVAFVDTPGFEDPQRSDAEILSNIAAWIKSNISSTHKITAVLYFHSIGISRMFKATQNNIRLFEQLVGKTAMRNVGLVSTHWDSVDTSVAEDREAWLIEN